MEVINARLVFTFALCACLASRTWTLPTEVGQSWEEDSDTRQETVGHHGGEAPSVLVLPSSDLDSESDDDSTEDSELIEKISQVFGIGNYSGINTDAARLEKSKTPRFMLNLYNSIANSTNGEERAETPYHATTIRSVKNEKGSRRISRSELHFRIDAIPSSELLLNADLYLFRLFPKLKGDRPKYYQVGIYQRTGTGQPKLVDSRQVSSHGTGWEVFNVYPTVQEWLTDQSSNLGFHVNVTFLTGEPAPEGALRFSLKKDDKRPNLVIFTKEPENNRESSGLSDEPTPPSSSNTERTPSLDSTRHHVSRRDAKTTAGPVGKTCGLESMYVNFERLGWAEHIVAPIGFKSNRCSGHCPFPAKEDIPYSTHALIQSFMAMEYPSIDGACCVPHELSSLTFLYVDGTHNTVVLRRVKNAVAVKCGCH